MLVKQWAGWDEQLPVWLRRYEAHSKRKHAGIFLGLKWGRLSAPFHFKNEQKLPKMVYMIPYFLVLHFGENFMKIRTKIIKLQMHENLHKIVNENMFSFTFLSRFL